MKESSRQERHQKGLLRLCIITIQIYRGNQGFECIRQNGVTPVAATFEFRSAKAQVISQFDIASHCREGFLLNQRSPDSRKFSFACLIETSINIIGDNQVQNTVTEELETLVITGTRVTAMAQGLFEKFVTPELVTGECA